MGATASACRPGCRRRRHQAMVRRGSKEHRRPQGRRQGRAGNLVHVQQRRRRHHGGGRRRGRRVGRLRAGAASATASRRRTLPTRRGRWLGRRRAAIKKSAGAEWRRRRGSRGPPAQPQGETGGQGHTRPGATPGPQQQGRGATHARRVGARALSGRGDRQTAAPERVLPPVVRPPLPPARGRGATPATHRCACASRQSGTARTAAPLLGRTAGPPPTATPAPAASAAARQGASRPLESNRYPVTRRTGIRNSIECDHWPYRPGGLTGSRPVADGGGPRLRRRSCLARPASRHAHAHGMCRPRRQSRGARP